MSQLNNELIWLPSMGILSPRFITKIPRESRSDGTWRAGFAFFDWNSTAGKLSCEDKIWISFRFPNCETSWNKISWKDRLVYNMLAICQDQIFMKICSYKYALLIVIIDHVSNFEKHLLRYLYQEVSLCNGKATDRVVRWPTSKFYWLLSVSLICSNLFSFNLGHGCPLQIHGNEISIK